MVKKKMYKSINRERIFRCILLSGPSSSTVNRGDDKEEMVAIFEEAAKKPAMPPPPLSGPELAAMMKVRCKRNR